MTTMMDSSLAEVMSAFEDHRAETLAVLRAEAKAMAERTGTPISVNDLRPFFETLGYDGDPRILGAVFRRRDGWQAVGQELGDSENAHPGRTVRRWRRV